MLEKITKDILGQVPDNTKLNEKDIASLNKHADFIIENSPAIVTSFYDTVFSHESTKVIFHEGEREIREKSLLRWFEKTVKSDFNQKYWEWQTFVGVLHVKRGVKNNMMISMMGHVSEFVIKASIDNLEKEEAADLINAWLKLSSTISALISESYRIFYLKAIEEVAGLGPSLLENVVKVEIDNMVKKYSTYRM